MTKVFINGSGGTTGLRLRSRLEGRADVELLFTDESLRRDADETRRLMAESDVTFLCLPDDAARDAVRLAEGLGTRVIDASTAHRTAPGWAYGFPELNPGHADKIAAADRVAVPGCHATGFVALAYPLISAGLLGSDYPLHCTSVTGYSGGGKAMIAEYDGGVSPLTIRTHTDCKSQAKEPAAELSESPHREGGRKSPRAYAMGQEHKHLAEMTAVCGLDAPPTFSPVIGDFYSGMLTSVPLRTALMPGKPGLRDIHEALRRHYDGSALIRVAEPGFNGILDAGAFSDRDDMRVYVTGNDERVVLHALFDNLGKGAAGAAIQCFDLINHGMV